MTAPSAPLPVERVADGVYRVVEQRRSHLVYVVAAKGGIWSFSNGRAFFVPDAADARQRRGTAHAVQSLAAPMPATVIKVLVKSGDTVTRGDIVVVLEAMKMELPLRASGEATVKAVHCREGELVQPDTTLVEFES